MKIHIAPATFLVVTAITSTLPTRMTLAASPGVTEAASFVDKLNTVIIFPTIALLSAVAFLVFLWGVAEYFLRADSEQARSTGLKHITWGIIGLVVMLSAFALLSIAARTIGLDDEINCANDPLGCGADPFTIP